MKTIEPLVLGYTPHHADTVGVVNRNKQFEEHLLRLCDEFRSREDRYDARWVSVAVTHFEQGFMALNRAVFKPQRIRLPEDDVFPPKPE